MRVSNKRTSPVVGAGGAEGGEVVKFGLIGEGGGDG